MVEFIIMKGCITFTSLVTASNRKARDSSGQTLASATFLAYFAKSQAIQHFNAYEYNWSAIVEMFWVDVWFPE